MHLITLLGLIALQSGSVDMIVVVGTLFGVNALNHLHRFQIVNVMIFSRSICQLEAASSS